MKIYLSIENSTINVGSILQLMTLTVENQEWGGLDMMALFDDLLITAKPNQGTPANTDFKIWLKTPFDIQKVDIVGDTIPFDQLESTSGNVLKNFVLENVVQFRKGKNYLVPYTAGAVTNVMPSQRHTVIGSKTPALVVDIASINYVYNSAKDEQTRNATTFEGISYDVDVQALQQLSAVRTAKMQRQAVAFSNALIN